MGFKPFHKMQIHFPLVILAVSPRTPLTTDLGPGSFPGQQKVSPCVTDKGIFPAMFLDNYFLLKAWNEASTLILLSLSAS